MVVIDCAKLTPFMNADTSSEALAHIVKLALKILMSIKPTTLELMDGTKSQSMLPDVN